MTSADIQAAVEPEDVPECRYCDRLDQATAKGSLYHWRCNAVPRVVPLQGVTGEPHLSEEPHERCIDVNRFFQCRFFEVRKEQDAQHT